MWSHICFINKNKDCFFDLPKIEIASSVFPLHTGETNDLENERLEKISSTQFIIVEDDYFYNHMIWFSETDTCDRRVAAKSKPKWETKWVA